MQPDINCCEKTFRSDLTRLVGGIGYEEFFLFYSFALWFEILPFVYAMILLMTLRHVTSFHDREALRTRDRFLTLMPLMVMQEFYFLEFATALASERTSFRPGIRVRIRHTGHRHVPREMAALLETVVAERALVPRDLSAARDVLRVCPRRRGLIVAGVRAGVADQTDYFGLLGD